MHSFVEGSHARSGLSSNVEVLGTSWYSYIPKTLEMEEDQKAHILKNLPRLIENTRCSVKLLARFVSKNLLSRDEEDIIVSLL